MANAITVLALTTFLLLLITGCGQSIGSDVRQYNPEFDCTRCDLRGVDLTRASLIWANLSGANLSKAMLYQADLSRSNLANAILTDANLSGGIDLSDANLTGADLSDTDLSGVYRADFRGAMNVPAEYLKP